MILEWEDGTGVATEKEARERARVRRRGVLVFILLGWIREVLVMVGWVTCYRKMDSVLILFLLEGVRDDEVVCQKPKEKLR